VAAPRAAGRPFVVHATDEIVTEFATELYDSPLHVIAVRTPNAKYAIYANWFDGGIDLLTPDRQYELYDYRTPGGRIELDNTAGTATLLEESMRALLLRAFIGELRAPLPRSLASAQETGLEDYLRRARRLAAMAARRRRRRALRLTG
jgi:hypothetical protein